MDNADLSDAWLASKQDKDWKKNYPKPKLVRELSRDVNNPLLIIYPLDPLGANPKDENSITIFQENDDVIIGFAIVFPKSNTQHTVEFAINTSLANEYYQSEIDFDDNDNYSDRYDAKSANHGIKADARMRGIIAICAALMVLNYLFMLFFKFQKDIVELLYHSMNIHILIFPLSLICVIYKLS